MTASQKSARYALRLLSRRRNTLQKCLLFAIVIRVRLLALPTGTFPNPPLQHDQQANAFRRDTLNAWEPACATSLPRRRLMRKDTEIIPRASTPPFHPQKRKKPLISIRHNPWLDGEAEYSGDEVSEGGSSHSEDDVESEPNRQLLKDIPGTQVSPSYDQFYVYRQSLLTQAPGVQNLPNFMNKPVRRGGSTNTRECSWYRPMVSSSHQGRMTNPMNMFLARSRSDHPDGKLVLQLT